MKIKQFLFAFFLLGLFFGVPTVKAQEPVERSTEIVKVGSKEYYMHHVKAGQTLYGIAKAYQVPVAEIEHLNPEVKDGLKVGYVIGIPVIDGQIPPVEPENQTEIQEAEPVEEPVQDPEIESVIIESTEEPVQVESVEEPAIEPVEEPANTPIVMKAGSHYVVQEGEDLYDIAKKFGIDVADFKAVNPGLTNYPSAGVTILVPDIQNESDYIAHKVEHAERTTALMKRWKVNESDFRVMNVSVGAHVFKNQVVLIPIDPVQIIVESNGAVLEEEGEEGNTEISIVEEMPEEPFMDEFSGEMPECKASPENARKRYNVALMVPLYLFDIDNLDASSTKASKSLKSRSMLFLQFYEGFMMAVDALEKEGLKLDLTVIDVTENTYTAEQAVSQIENKHFDMIVGPFFWKSFAIVEEYAKSKGIIVVNPLSNRESVIEGNPNVVKVKPGDVGQILTLSNLVKNYYNTSNVFIVSKEEAADTAYLTQLEHHLNLAVNSEVAVSGDEFLHFARNESERLEMGSKLVSTVDVEGQVYSVKDFQTGATDMVVLSNSVKRYSYGDIGNVTSQLSGVRNNLIIAYGDDNVFATQILNTLTKSADRFPITLVCAPDWSRFEKLLVDNLLKMNAIYVNDYFVDYKSDAAKRFVLRFRGKYLCEPQNYAFEGYDVGMYFLSALMRYGDNMMECLHCHHVPLLHTDYRFYYRNYLKSGQEEGKENLYWSIYQYDKNDIELKPIDPFKQKAK